MLLVLLLQLITTTASIDPEASMTVMQIIRYWGYPVERHEVFTKDGFILDLYRIPHGRRGHNLLPRSTPILMVPGLGASSAAFVQNPPESSPAMILADAGFDVFLLNYRGTRYGMGHTMFTPEDNQFWQYSLDDYANGDAPAVVDRVLTITGQSALSWIGHSQGTSVGFMMLADNPSYNRKIRGIFALTPVGTIHHAKGVTSLFVALHPILRPFIAIHHYFFGAHQMGSNHKWLIEIFAEKLCRVTIIRQICESFLINLFGAPSASFNRSRHSVYLSHFPDGTSSWILAHYGQLSSRNEIRHFETCLWSRNSAHYNYSNIAAPVYLFWSKNDRVTPREEIEKGIIPRMREGVIKATIEITEYNHLDFILATDISRRVFSVITRIIYAMEQEDTPWNSLIPKEKQISPTLNFTLPEKQECERKGDNLPISFNEGVTTHCSQTHFSSHFTYFGCLNITS